jgi:hypothetical protein
VDYHIHRREGSEAENSAPRVRGGTCSCWPAAKTRGGWGHDPREPPGLWFRLRDLGFERLPFVALHANPGGDICHIPGTQQPVEPFAREVLRQMDVMVRHGLIGVPALAAHLVIGPVWHPGSDPTAIP